MYAARIEKWGKNIKVGEYEELFYFVNYDGKKWWFDDDFKEIPNPLGYKGYDMKEFYKTVTETKKQAEGKLYNQTKCGSFKTDDYDYDIIFKEDGLMPYNSFLRINIKDELEKIIKEKIWKEQERIN